VYNFSFDAYFPMTVFGKADSVAEASRHFILKAIHEHHEK
jgi:hypothetical protein